MDMEFIYNEWSGHMAYCAHINVLKFLIGNGMVTYV